MSDREIAPAENEVVEEVRIIEEEEKDESLSEDENGEVEQEEVRAVR